MKKIALILALAITIIACTKQTPQQQNSSTTPINKPASTDSTLPAGWGRVIFKIVSKYSNNNCLGHRLGITGIVFNTTNYDGWNYGDVGQIGNGSGRWCSKDSLISTYIDTVMAPAMVPQYFCSTVWYQPNCIAGNQGSTVIGGSTGHLFHHSQIYPIAGQYITVIDTIIWK